MSDDNDLIRYGYITRSIAAGLQVELDGDWVKLNRVVRDLDRDIAQSAMEAQEAIAQKYKKALRKNMKENRFGFQLSKAYSEFKAEHGGPNTPLIWTRKYYNSIIIRTNKTGRLVQVTIKDSAYYSGSSHGASNRSIISVKEVANILEHGSNVHNITARPLWKLTFRDLGGKAGIQQSLNRSLAQRLSTRVNTK
jgi:hypothetical protein